MFRNPPREDPKRKATRNPHGRPNAKELEPEMTLERKGASLKWEAGKLDFTDRGKGDGCSELIGSPEVTGRKRRKLPALDQKQEKCPKLISIREPKGFVPI